MRLTLAPLAVLCMLAPAQAHHSRANFLNETIVLQGEVASFRWANPHAFFTVNVLDATGKATQWEVETAATPQLSRSGWNEGSLRAGDRVTVRAQPDRNRERHYAYLQSVLKDDGKLLSVTPADATLDTSRPLAESVFGVWQPATRRPGGAGIAPGPADEGPFGLPLTPKGVDAARAFDVSTNPRLRCVPFQTPENLGTPYLHTLARAGGDVVLRTEYMEIERIVHMDGRAPAAGERTRQGFSVGRWEGDVLIVETTNFSDDAWGTARGIPGGAQKRVVERYRLTDGGATLTVDFKIENPEYLTEPFEGSELWRYAPKLVPVPNKCDPEVARRYLGTD